MNSYFRFLKKNPYYTIINVLGLSVALMFVIMIGDYTWRQFSTDSWHRNKDRIVLMGNSRDFFSWPDECRQMAAGYPEIEATCCIESLNGKITAGENTYQDDGPTILLADSTFFSLFDFPFIEGTPEDALSSPEKCVITKSLANVLFPNGNPLGQSLRIAGSRNVFIDGENCYDENLLYTVSAVIEDFDRTVHPNKTQIIVNMQRSPELLGFHMQGKIYATTGYGSFKTFMLLHEGADITPKGEEMYKYIKEHCPAFSFGFPPDDVRMTFTPLRELMFAPQSDGQGLERSDKSLLVILLSAIIAILVFAITNYINLTVANTGMRAKEMATRRLLGSSQNAISMKLILESILMVLVSFVIGFLLALLFQDKLAEMFRGRISLLNDINPSTITVCTIFIIVTGVLSGIIPSMQIATFSPIDVVKGSFRYKSKMLFSRVFIMIQNIATVVMLTLSLVVMLQIDGLVNAPMGLNTKDIVILRPTDIDVPAVLDVLKSLPCVERVGVNGGSCLGTYRSTMTNLRDRESNPHIVLLATLDKEAFDIYGLKELRNNGVEVSQTLYTEQFFRDMGLDPNATEIDFWSEQETIDGVVADFHDGSVLTDVRSYKIEIKDPEKIISPYYVVKTDGSPEAARIIREAVDNVIIEKSENALTFIDPQLEISERFDEERNTLKIINMFTGIALLISIFGFIGLSLFFIRQRRKEIATRRVFGGSIMEVIVLMLTKFCAPLLISTVLAVPVAYLVAERWLQDFSWRISLSPWIFIVACVISLVVAVLAILWQTVRAVSHNPADSIKSE